MRMFGTDMVQSPMNILHHFEYSINHTYVDMDYVVIYVTEGVYNNVSI